MIAADIKIKNRDVLVHVECGKQGLTIDKLSDNRQQVKSNPTLIQCIATTQKIQCVMR